MASPNSTFTELVSTTFRKHRKEIKDNLYEVVAQRRAKANAFSMRQTIENVAAFLYNNAFSTTYFTVTHWFKAVTRVTTDAVSAMRGLPSDRYIARATIQPVAKPKPKTRASPNPAIPARIHGNRFLTSVIHPRYPITPSDGRNPAPPRIPGYRK